MGVGQRILERRQALGFTQSQLAGDGFSAAYISQLERGKTKPSLKALSLIASRLGCSVNELISDSSADISTGVEYLLARVYRRLNEYENAFDHSVRADQEPFVTLEMAAILVKQRNFTKARTLIEDTISHHEGFIRTYGTHLLAFSFMEERNMAQAASLYKEVYQSHPSDLMLRLMILFNYTGCLQAIDQHDEAVRVLTEGLAELDNIQDINRFAQQVLQQAEQAKAQDDPYGEFHSALVAYSLIETKGLFDTLAGLFNRMGVFMIEKKDHVGAISNLAVAQQFSRISGHNGLLVDSYLNAAQSCLETSEYDQSSSLAKEALTLLEGTTSTLEMFQRVRAEIIIGEGLLVLGQTAEAEKRFEIAISELPEQHSDHPYATKLRVRALSNLSSLKRSQGKNSEADHLAAEVVALLHRSEMLK